MSLFRRVANLFRRTRIDEQIDAELQSHIALRTEDNLAEGMSPAEARRDALLRFGNPTVVRERTVAADAALFLDGVARDLRYALRQLRRSPGFALTAIVTLMLGIGANVVVFGVLNAVLLHPLEVSDPGSLYQLRHKAWTQGKLLTHSYPAFDDLRRRNTTFSDMAGIDGYSHAELNSGSIVRNISGDEVTGNYFDLLGVQPAIGRFFHATDEHGPDSAPYLVLSDSLWRGAFHADQAIVGKTVELDKHPFTIVGIAPASFHGAERFVWPDYWIPMANEGQLSNGDYLHNRTSPAVTVIGRLKPGVTPQQATENLNTIVAELAREYPETDEDVPLRLIHPGLYGDAGDVIRGFLWSVTLLALLVLAAACANLATLFAARAADRSRELALRVALGSSRRRLVRQLLTEAVMVSSIGGAMGLGTGYLLIAALNRSSPFAGSLTVSVDTRVYLVGLALTLASGLLFGMVPARQIWQSSPLQMMKGGSELVRRFALRDLLLGAQIAICTLLVTASLVAVRGMVRTLNAPLGFRPKGAMLVDLDLSEQGQPDDAGEKSVIDAARSISGVTAAGAVNRTPMTGGLHGIPIFEPGATEFKIKNSALAPYVFSMSPGYLEAAGTKLLRGRDVAWNDTQKTPSVAVVNETFARKMWAQNPALGRRFIVWGKLTEVVGVTEDGKYHDLPEAPQPVVYLASAQSGDGDAVLVVRSERSPREMEAALQHALSGSRPASPITVRSWSDTLSDELFPARAATVALGVMGLLAAMLAVTGIFGMAAYNVSRRMKELGIRVALGANSLQVLQSGVGRPVALLVAGSALGLLLGAFASQLLGRIVYQANPRDPLVLGGAIVTMTVLGAAAAWIPARRALRADPSHLMREE